MTIATSADANLRTVLDAAATASSPAVTLRLLDDALRTDPRLDDAALLHHARANALLAVGRIDDAVSAADRAVTLAPGLPDLVTNLGAALLARFRQLGGADDLTHAVRALREAVELGPRTPHVRATLALALSTQGRHVDAIVVCDDNLARFPDDAPTLFNRAAALHGAQRTAEARAILLALSTTFPPAQAALARLG